MAGWTKRSYNGVPTSILTMINKLLLLLAFTTIIFFDTKAQVKFGVKGGLNIATQVPILYGGINGEIAKVNGKSIRSFIGSFFSDINLTKKLVLRPEAGFSGEGFLRKEISDFQGNILYDERTYKLKYLNLPVHLLYTPTFHGGSFYVGCGPFASVLLGGKVQNQVGEAKIKIGNRSTDDFKRFDAGINGTAGIKLKQGLLFGSSYKWGVLDVTPYYLSANNKNRVLSFFVGYNF